MDRARTGAPRLHVLAKPTGAACNLDCAYCFFLEKEKLYPGSRFRMTDEVLEAYVRGLIEAHPGPGQVTVAWQGGEPTLMGLEFFRRALELQRRHARPGQTFENTIQTNGTLLDDAWCAFLKEHDFLVGISLDGPARLHDVYRLDKGGRPTFDKVLRGVRLLQKHGVRYNVLVALNSANAEHPLAVYRFLRDEVGAEWLQLIPVVERLGPEGDRPLHQQGDRVSDRSVRPGQLGRFLCGVFDEWVRRDVGNVFIPTFEAAGRSWLRLPSSGMCVFDETCGHGLALEHNGDVYACDHYVEPEFLLGNLTEQPLRALADQPRQRAFGEAKRTELPRQCRECEVRFACHGECPKNRFLTTDDGEPGLNYLCEGYRTFFRHIDRPMKILAALLRAGRPASEVSEILAREESAERIRMGRVGRNAPCPCGSGLKFKRCHGAGGTTTSRAG